MENRHWTNEYLRTRLRWAQLTSVVAGSVALVALGAAGVAMRSASRAAETWATKSEITVSDGRHRAVLRADGLKIENLERGGRLSLTLTERGGAGLAVESDGSPAVSLGADPLGASLLVSGVSGSDIALSTGPRPPELQLLFHDSLARLHFPGEASEAPVLSLCDDASSCF